MELPKRFTDKIEVVPSGCWNWRGSKSYIGYGQFRWNSRLFLAHRFAYGWFHEIPPNQEILHSCDNRMCVNPEHLTTGTHRANMHDAIRKGRHRGVCVTDEMIAEMKRLSLLQWTYTQIARKVGCSWQSVQYTLQGRPKRKMQIIENS